MARAILKNLAIESVSAYLPETRLDLRALGGGNAEAEKIIRATGIEQVRVAAKTQTAADLCLAAARPLLAGAETPREEIDGVIFVSQTPDYLMPETAFVIQAKLGLSETTLCRDIRIGCSGYIHGLFQAALWISCGACRRVLLLAGDTSTRLANPRDRALRMVFGDAGTATLVSAGKFDAAFAFRSDGSGARKLFVPAGGFRLPHSEETAKISVDEDGNARSANDLFMDGMEIFRFSLACVPANIRETLALAGWEKDDVGLFALHQANAFIVDAVRKNLRVPAERVPVNVRGVGNTGPASVPLLLSMLFGEKSGRTRPELKRALLCGFGIGLSWGCAATEALSETRFFSPENL